jgi:Pyruvate/2-oxoacid:ferredoxin oxidoreductase delta subunit
MPDGATKTSLSLRYFSGTGNTYRVASWIGRTAEARGVVVDVGPISALGGEGYPPVDGSGRRLLGVLTPTHGFTATRASLAYAAMAPGVRGADVFTVVTRAGWFVGPVRLPGLEGTAAWLLALVLVLRGGHLVGVRAIDMPSNWTALHWGLNDEHIAAIVQYANKRAASFADRILDGRPQMTGWLSLAAGLLLAPVSLLYLAVARPLLGKLLFADERCTSCGLCTRHCPCDAVHMKGGSPRRPFWTVDCESCMRCMNICPERAIQASWLAVTAQLLAFLVVFEVVVGAAGAAAGLGAQAAAFVAASVAILALTGPAYRIMWLLARPRGMSWLLGHTTPTRVFRRYREPGTNLRDI